MDTRGYTKTKGGLAKGTSRVHTPRCTRKSLPREVRSRRSKGTCTRAFRAIDSFVNQLNQVIGSAGDMYGGQGPFNSTEEDASDEELVESEGDKVPADSKVLDTTGHKKIAMKFKVIDRIDVQQLLKLDEIEEDSVDCKKNGHLEITLSSALGEYLSLPVEQYSVLNSEWIVRLEEEGEGHFMLRIPLQEMIGIQLEPSLQAEVQTTSSHGKDEASPPSFSDTSSMPEVLITGKETKTGSDIFDELFDISFSLLLKEKKDKKDKENVLLMGTLALNMNVSVPSPLSMLPSPVLRGAGGTLVGLVTKKMLTGFLTLLVKDFEKWYIKQYSETKVLPHV